MFFSILLNLKLGIGPMFMLDYSPNKLYEAMVFTFVLYDTKLIIKITDDKYFANTCHYLHDYVLLFKN